MQYGLYTGFHNEMEMENYLECNVQFMIISDP